MRENKRGSEFNIFDIAIEAAGGEPGAYELIIYGSTPEVRDMESRVERAILAQGGDSRSVDVALDALYDYAEEWIEARDSRRANRRVANADHAEAVDFVFSSFDKDMEEFSWWYFNDYDGLYANVEKILSRGFTGGPFDIDKIIVDVVNGKSRFSKRRASHRKNSKNINERVEVRLEGEFTGFSVNDFRRFVEQYGLVLSNIDTELAYLGSITLYISGDSDLVYDFIDEYEV